MVPERDVVIVVEDAKRPERDVGRLAARELETVVDAVVVHVAVQDLVHIDGAQLIVGVIADVADLEGGVTQDLALHHDVPLPAIGRHLIDGAALRRNAARNVEAPGARRNVTVECTCAGDRLDERRVDAPRASVGLSRSRRKNWPMPARTAVLPSPLTSQAAPTRGAKLLMSWSISESFGPSAPPRAPASWHQVVPGGWRMPLHGSLPSDGLKSDGWKLVSLVIGGVGVVVDGVAEPVVERDARRHLPRIGHVELEVVPALWNRASRRAFREAPRHVAQQEVGEQVAGVRKAVRGQAGGAPERGVLLRSVAVRILVLRVPAHVHPGLQEVLPEDLRVVVLEDVEVLVVVERRLVPERFVAGAAPEHRVRDAIAILLVVKPENRLYQRRDLRRLIRGLATAGDLYLVCGVRELDGVGRARAERLAQRRDERLGRLIPVASRRPGSRRLPRAACWRSVRRPCRSSSRPACSGP